MLEIRFFVRLPAVLVSLILILGVWSCDSEPLPVPPPPPVITTNATISQMEQVPAPPVATANATTSQSEQTGASDNDSSSDAPHLLRVNITSDLATIAFPDRITFSLEGTGNQAVKSILLKYGSDKRSLVAEINTIELEFQGGTKINTSWDWEMKKTGSLPPGATVWWQWEITDMEGMASTTLKQSMTYQDTRFQWQVTRLDTMDIYWHGQSQALIQELTTELESKLARIQLNSTIPVERKPKIFVYSTSEQLRGAILHEQEWTGAVAYPNYNIILTAVNANNLEWAKRALPHEITHLLVGELIFGPFGDIPTWLNEGLARYSEGDITESDRKILDEARKENSLISVTSLSSSFPTASRQAHLAYAESGSIVTFLIDNFGWEKIRQLLLVFKEGSTYDNALQEVYGFDTDGLEAQWKKYLEEST